MSKLTPLGLPEDAAPEEVEARYAELTAFLRSKAVPASLRSWAEQQLVLLDDYYASEDLDEWEAPPVHRARRDGARAQALPRPKERRRGSARKHVPRARPRSLSWPGGWGGRALAGLIAGALVVAAIAGVLYFRGDGSEAQPGAPGTTGQTETLDEGRIAELMAIVAQQPDNQDALFELGERYFTAGQWQPAIDWFAKLVALSPSDTHALTDIGTAYFNLGQPQEAKQYWEQVIQVDPNDLQAHYNLGFFYANVEPQDLESAIREWETVIRLDPNSTQAQTAQVHIEGLKAQPTAQPTPEAPPTQVP